MLMKKRANYKWILGCILMLSVICFLLQANPKVLFHEDEIMTFCLANSSANGQHIFPAMIQHIFLDIAELKPLQIYIREIIRLPGCSISFT